MIGIRCCSDKRPDTYKTLLRYNIHYNKDEKKLIAQLISSQTIEILSTASPL